MVAPTIVIVPGLWLGPRPYELLVEEMKKAAPSLTDFVYAPLKSTGIKSPGNPTMSDDAMGIREVIKPLVQNGKKVVIVCHSAGGFLSGMATEDLEVGQKLAAPSGGGVERFIFVTAGILPVGALHPELEFMEIKDNGGYCKDPDHTLYNDVDPEVAKKYHAFTKCQPAEGWNGVCTYAGWEKVPSNYILCELDNIISPAIQEHCANLAKSEILRLSAGHMPMLSKPKELAEMIVSCIKL